GTWGDDGTIVYGIGGPTGLYRVSADGGTPELLIKPDANKKEAAFVLPTFLPGSKAFLFLIRTLPLNTTRIAVFDLNTKVVKPIVEVGGRPQYVSSGHVVYAVDGILRGVAFDRDHLEVHGTPVSLVEHVATKSAVGTPQVSNFAVSRNGTLVYRAGDFEAPHDQQRTLVWVDRSGREEAVGVPNRTFAYARMSPDQSKIAFDIRDQESGIWVWDVIRHGPLTRLTFDLGAHRGAVWSPDGRRVAFSIEREGKENIYWQLADG